MEILYENEIVILNGRKSARTSPLLDCAGIFLYNDDVGILVHYRDKEVEPKIDNMIDGLRFLKAVIGGCGFPTECLPEDSEVYVSVKDYLQSRKIDIVREDVGKNHPVSMIVSMPRVKIRKIHKVDSYIE